VLLNFVLVPTMGPMGAAISTAICYVEVWILRLRRSRRYIRLRINLKRDIAAYVLLGAQSIALICIADEAFMYATVIGLFVAIALLYTKEIACVVKKALNRRHGVER
jgi:O-antigen/teichoic acid export membrane protein